jgi:hypothetical protein
VTIESPRPCLNPACRALLSTLSRPDKRYCSTACRVAAHRWAQATDRLPPAALARLAEELPPAVAEGALVAGIARAAAADWKAAAFILERRFPSRWGPATEPVDVDEDWSPDGT